ncbi:biopolymer transporter ExbD [Telmatospirillum sp. J64-1]|uniref:ExbD/TolR family protein n=1 Tax=Telmatospirillum sp. J64-1 TaxID=2502183 RepID=UPI00115F00EA|nr:biopolymer transporter ExbD [Telmatospirillum sp. J64-1]
MEFRKTEEREQPENVLPLINVVFLLLIFFMIAGVLEKADLFDVEPPVMASGTEAEAGEGLLLIAADGRLAFEGNEITADSLDKAVAAFRAREPDMLLRLKADGAAPAEHVIEVMEMLKEAGVERVMLLALERRS